MRSDFLRLTKNDYVKGFVVAVLGAWITTLYSALINQEVIDIKSIIVAGVIAGLAYLIKNFFTDSSGKVFGIIG